MFRGIIALFTSGVILNPLVLLGIFSGFYAMIKLETGTIIGLFGDMRFYAVIACIAAVYTLVFAKIYQEGGLNVDWPATSARILWNFVRYFISFVLSMSFIMMISIF